MKDELVKDVGSEQPTFFETEARMILDPALDESTAIELSQKQFELLETKLRSLKDKVVKKNTQRIAEHVEALVKARLA